MAYATAADLANIMPAGNLAAVSTAQISDALAKASAMADGVLGNQFLLPLVPPYPADLVAAVCNLAMYQLMRLAGYNTEAGANKWVRDSFDDAQKWLAMVSKGVVTPAGITDSKNTVRLSGPLCASNPRRGW